MAAPSCSADGLFASSASAEADMISFRSLLAADLQNYTDRIAALAPAMQPTGNFVKRIKANERGSVFDRSFKCLKPAKDLADLNWQHAFDRELLMLKLRRGRVCDHELCKQTKCGLHVRDGIVTREEAAALVAHGDGILESEGSAARDVDKPYVRVDFLRSAHNGSISGHVLTLRVAERIRRLASKAFGLPLERVGLAETLLALRRTDMPQSLPRSPPKPAPSPSAASSSSMAQRGSDDWNEEGQAVADSADAYESFWHCDEALAEHFHFSTILWLSEQGEDFDGGELAFLHNSTIAWLLVEPSVGRGAFFSSGWENVHGIHPLTRGRRWALSVPLMVSDELKVNNEARRLEEAQAASKGERVRDGTRFRELCVAPADKHAYQRCRAEWASVLSSS